MIPEEYMMPCFWKSTFNIECFGCGTQRALALILQGEFVGAFKMYPAIYTLILLGLFMILHLKFKFKQGHNIILGLFILNVMIIILNFILKHF